MTAVVLKAGVVVSGLIASGFWLQSASITVRDNQDKFMEDITLVSLWNRGAAQMSAVTALLAAVSQVWDWVSVAG